MATVKERAIKFANDYSDGDSATIQGLVNTVAYDSYNHGATEQREIDIEKACKVIHNIMRDAGYDWLEIMDTTDLIRKAIMEE